MDKPKIMILWKHEWVCVSKDEVRGYGNTPTSAYRDWCIASAHHRRGRRGTVYLGGTPRTEFRIAKEELTESRRWLWYAAKVVFGFVAVGVVALIMLK